MWRAALWQIGKAWQTIAAAVLCADAATVHAGGGFRSWGGCWGWLLLGVASAAAVRMVSGRASAAALRMGFLGCPQRVALCVRFAAAAADILFIINNVKKLDKSEIIN